MSICCLLAPCEKKPLRLGLPLPRMSVASARIDAALRRGGLGILMEIKPRTAEVQLDRVLQKGRHG